MEPDIERMPFIIQRQIMDFKPRLFPIHNYATLRKHLSKRYCQTCGEYIDLVHHINKPYPRHIHRGRKKFQPKRYKYLSVFPSIHFHLNHELIKTYSCVIYSYFNMTTEGMTLPFKILFLKKQVEYLYNLKKMVNNEYKKCVPMYNIQNINIFHNPDFIWIDHPELFGYFNRYVVFDQPLQRGCFIDLFDMLKHKYIYNIEYYYFYYMLKDKNVFYYLADGHPTDVINVFEHYNLLCSNLFLEKLDLYPLLLNYLSERKLRKIYEKNRSWFLERRDQLNEYIELFCPLEETHALRQI